ncbi:MAG: SulP family inorganic anion transporter, partial [Gammaproteobacteria bacterium]
MIPQLRRAVPLLDDLANTRGRTLPQDILAGTITATLLIPQALAYALLAGLPPQVGLYASVLPPIIYALTGSSRTLAVGPAAVAAVMVSSALADFAGGDLELALGGALLLSAISGGFLLLLGVLRLGWLTHFISHPVLAGFTTGAAILIIGTQLPTLLGVNVGNAAFGEILWGIAQRFDHVNVIALAFGLCAILALAARTLLVGWLRALGVGASAAAVFGRAAPLLLVVLTTGIAMAFDLSSTANLPVIG